MLEGAEIKRASHDPCGAMIAGARHAEQVSMYLTDGVFLYRLVDLLVTNLGTMADIEDCYGLDIVRVGLRDVRARRLRVVTPG